MISTADADAADHEAGSILIVDDDQSVIDTFARMLQLEGFTVATALDPTVGLHLAESIRPEAIIVDLRMPLITGIQFLRQLRTRPDLAAVPVAIVTGDYFISDELQQELTSLGATLRFKPLWLEDLVALAKTLIPR